MQHLKELTIEAINKLPDECSPEDIMYQVNFVAQILQGMDDAKNGKVITTEELLAKIDTWQPK